MPQTNNESEAKIPAKRRKSPRRRWKRALLLLVLMTLLILRVERNVTGRRADALAGDGAVAGDSGAQRGSV